MYASYTYFRVASWWAALIFQWHALRSGTQAFRSKGLIKMQVFSRGGREFFTLTSWKSKEDMLRFRNSGPHLIAMKLSSKMGSGYTTGWECEGHPSREDGEQKLREKLQEMQMEQWLETA